MHNGIRYLVPGILVLSMAGLASADFASVSAIKGKSKYVRIVSGDGDSAPQGSLSGSESVTQTIVLSSEQLALLANDTTVHIEGLLEKYEIKFSDDPNYVPGATSVKINNVDGNEDTVVTVKGTMDWSSGNMVMKLKAKFISTGIIENKKTKDVEYEELETVFEQGGSPVIESEAEFALGVKFTESEKINFDESFTNRESLSLVTGPIAPDEK